MGRRSLRASLEGIQAIKRALRKKKGGQTYLAGAVGCSRQTIWSLLKGNPTDCDVFMDVCSLLDLKWEEIAEPEAPEPQQDDTQDIDVLVREVRERIQPYIQEKCGTMRVLDMTQPIGLGEIYTNVNILEKLTRTRGLELTELMQDANPEQFERFCLGDVRELRVPGLEAVEKFSKLMILGKPGAGKTTFLKHLAIQCIGGEFQGDRVPVFITLKDFAEADDKPNLLEYVSRLVPHNVEIPPTPLFKGGYKQDLRKRGNEEEEELVPPFSRGARGDLRQILNAGRALILLDGLDEVRDADSSRVLRQIREFSQQLPQNQFVITCRIAAREYTFEQFTEVEIADFDDEQIADFSGKWFRSKNDPIKAERLLQKLEEDEPIRELATNPLLLTLLCLVFEDSGSFPTNRAEVYQTGLDVLLKKWDVKRNIEREQVYKRLSLKRKEDLLSQIARTTFEAGNYFFKQREVERYISQYIQNLPDASTDPEALELDSAAVLKSIEGQHGLFVERARGIYSFSHLTFHEYFTARKIVTSCNPYAADDAMLQGLVNHITEKRWREVFLLTVGMLDRADALLRLMKARIDGLLAGDEKLQQFLKWVDEKARSVELMYKPAALRSFYFDMSCLLSRAINLGLALVRKIDSSFPLPNAEDFSISGTQNISVALDFNLCVALNISIVAVWSKLVGDGEEKRDQEDKGDRGGFFSQPTTYDHTRIVGTDIKKAALLSSVNRATDLAFKIDEELHLKIQEFQEKLPPELTRGIKLPDSWWRENGQTWTEQLRTVMVKHRNIGHDWQFSDTQKELLQQYYDANKLLVDCLNSDCYVSREVRQEIEETLLLPIAEIKKWQQRVL